jgi:hypothetical protein
MKYFQLFLIGLLPFILAVSRLSVNIQTHGLQADSLRAVLTVTINYDDKMVTPFVDVTVNCKLFKTVFDTGSTGLRMMEGALPPEPADTLNQRVSYTYGDNVHKLSLKGKVRKVQVAFDKLNTLSTVGIMCIDSTRYTPTGSWIATGDSAIIRSNHFRNCSAILGVGLRKTARLSGVISPLSQLPGNGKFIVMFPGYGGTKGSVIINPSPADEAGFVYFQLPQGKATPNGSGWLDNQLPGCISVTGETACLPTLLDSGNPDIQVFSHNFIGQHSVPSGNYITMRVGGLKDSIFVKTGFNVGDQRSRGKDLVYLDESPKEPRMVFGIRFFFEFDVLYDQQNGIIGIRKKSNK